MTLAPKETRQHKTIHKFTSTVRASNAEDTCKTLFYRALWKGGGMPWEREGLVFDAVGNTDSRRLKFVWFRSFCRGPRTAGTGAVFADLVAVPPPSPLRAEKTRSNLFCAQLKGS